MVAGDGEDGPFEGAQEVRRARELCRPAAVAQVAARDDELGLESLHQRRRSALDGRVVTGAVVQVGQVQNACKHGRGRL